MFKPQLCHSSAVPSLWPQLPVRNVIVTTEWAVEDVADVRDQWGSCASQSPSARHKAMLSQDNQWQLHSPAARMDRLPGLWPKRQFSSLSWEVTLPYGLQTDVCTIVQFSHRTIFSPLSALE